MYPATMAAYMAMLFLIAGLLSILTDQGRMDRVFVEPFTHFNLRSMFSINPILYMGHIFLCIVYLWALFREMPRLTKVAAVTVVSWAIAVHTGTGMILGCIPRELHQSPLLPPSFQRGGHQFQSPADSFRGRLHHPEPCSGIGVDDLHDIIVFPEMHTVAAGTLERDPRAVHFREPVRIIGFQAPLLLDLAFDAF